jgi:hypothetical protein
MIEFGHLRQQLPGYRQEDRGEFLAKTLTVLFVITFRTAATLTQHRLLL